MKRDLDRWYDKYGKSRGHRKASGTGRDPDGATSSSSSSSVHGSHHSGDERPPPGPPGGGDPYEFFDVGEGPASHHGGEIPHESGSRATVRRNASMHGGRHGRASTIHEREDGAVSPAGPRPYYGHLLPPTQISEALQLNHQMSNDFYSCGYNEEIDFLKQCMVGIGQDSYYGSAFEDEEPYNYPYHPYSASTGLPPTNEQTPSSSMGVQIQGVFPNQSSHMDYVGASAPSQRFGKGAGFANNLHRSVSFDWSNDFEEPFDEVPVSSDDCLAIHDYLDDLGQAHHGQCTSGMACSNQAAGILEDAFTDVFAPPSPSGRNGRNWRNRIDRNKPPVHGKGKQKKRHWLLT